MHIQSDIAYDSTDGYIRSMYKSAKKTKFIRRYVEDLALHTGALTVHWEYSTSFIYTVESKRVTLRVKNFYIPVCFILEKIYSGISIPKY